MKKSLYLLIGVLHATPLVAADPASAPAVVSKEADLVVVRLKPEAEQRLRMKVVPVESRRVPDVRVYPGLVVRTLAAGSTVAPQLGGTLDEFLRLAELQIQADDRVRQAQVQEDVARIAFKRAEKLLGSESGSARQVDEARAALGLAESALLTAQSQRALLGGSALDPSSAGRQWVRVAIPSSEAALSRGASEAKVGHLGTSRLETSARRIPGPPTANALANTVDSYFELPDESPFKAGERVAVEIPVEKASRSATVVPFNAVLRDFHGGEWIYERTGTHAYTRRRVQVARIHGTDAVLESGPPAGAMVVTDGSAELFGTEFMTGK
ncbi:MAG: hypothetical protein WCR07_14810 [Verrucomicrobiota bacterium]|jgi:hypothetical protein